MSEELPAPSNLELDDRLQQVERIADEDTKDLSALRARIAVLEGCLDPILAALMAIPEIYGNKGTLPPAKAALVDKIYAAVNHLNGIVRPNKPAS